MCCSKGLSLRGDRAGECASGDADAEVDPTRAEGEAYTCRSSASTCAERRGLEGGGGDDDDDIVKDKGSSRSDGARFGEAERLCDRGDCPCWCRLGEGSGSVEWRRVERECTKAGVGTGDAATPAECADSDVAGAVRRTPTPTLTGREMRSTAGLVMPALLSVARGGEERAGGESGEEFCSSCRCARYMSSPFMRGSSAATAASVAAAASASSSRRSSSICSVGDAMAASLRASSTAAAPPRPTAELAGGCEARRRRASVRSSKSRSCSRCS